MVSFLTFRFCTMGEEIGAFADTYLYETSAYYILTLDTSIRGFETFKGCSSSPSLLLLSDSCCTLVVIAVASSLGGMLMFKLRFTKDALFYIGISVC